MEAGRAVVPVVSATTDAWAALAVGKKAWSEAYVPFVLV